MHAPSYWRGLAACTSAFLLLATSAPAQDDKVDRMEKGEGVITKVEPFGEESKDGPHKVKITINTAAVWRDYVRDQANFAANPDAKDGANSVAAKGQPESESTEIVAEVLGSTKLSMRYRSSTDDVSEGARTIEKAEKKDGSPESDDVKTSSKDEKAPKMTVKDLKPGLFVAIDAKNGKADKLTVLKPVGGPATPASEAAPKAK